MKWLDNYQKGRFDVTIDTSSLGPHLDRLNVSTERLMVAIAFLVGTLVVGLVIYTATIERQREYGVLKAIGARNGLLYRTVITQALIASGAGSIIGIRTACGGQSPGPITAPAPAAKVEVEDGISMAGWPPGNRRACPEGKVKTNGEG